MHFKTPQNEIKCVLSIKKSNFKAQNGSTFSHLLTFRAEGLTPLSQPADFYILIVLSLTLRTIISY